MCAALSVHPGGTLLSVGGTGEDNIGELSTDITVVALVDNEGVLGNGLGVDLVSVEEVDELGLRGSGVLGGSEADIVSSGTGCNLLHRCQMLIYTMERHVDLHAARR